MIAQNLAHQAVLRGISVRFVATSDMLNDLASVDGSARKHRIKRYVNPKLLAIDEVGYLSYDTRHADLLYEVVRQRYDARRSIVLTTNKGFSEWNQVFDSAACVVTLIDRLCHRADIVELDGESYRAKEAQARAKLRRDQRRAPKPRMTHAHPDRRNPAGEITRMLVGGNTLRWRAAPSRRTPYATPRRWPCCGAVSIRP